MAPAMVAAIVIPFLPPNAAPTNTKRSVSDTIKTIVFNPFILSSFFQKKDLHHEIPLFDRGKGLAC
jgi:hypothetical protein